MHPVVQDKIQKLRQYASIALPEIPDWVVEEDGRSSNNPRCCTTLHDFGVEDGDYPKQIWYEGEIECGGDGTTINPKGYGIIFRTELGGNEWGHYSNVIQGLFDGSGLYNGIFEQWDSAYFDYRDTIFYGIYMRTRVITGALVPGTIWESTYP